MKYLGLAGNADDFLRKATLSSRIGIGDLSIIGGKILQLSRGEIYPTFVCP